MSYNDIYFTVWGILSAALWMVSSLLSIIAIQNAGLAVSQGVWSGCTIIISFLWGAVIFKQPMKSVGISVVGILLLLLGIAGISLAGSSVLDRFRKMSHVQIEDSLDLNSISVNDENKSNRVFGLACCVGLSLTNGSMLAPIHYAPPEASGIIFLASFGIGVLVITPILAVIYFTILHKTPNWDFENLLLPGFFAGIVWNIGNWASIYATTILGFTVGYPLTQCALLMAAFWGITLFKEVTGLLKIGSFILSSFVLLGGAVILAIYGNNPSN